MRQLPNLIGQQFGDLMVIDQAESSPAGKRKWLCKCTCGNQTVVFGANLTRGTTVSCGCRRTRDLTGQRIGTLTVLKRSDRYGSRGKRKTQLWECQCDCGAITYKATDTLTNPAQSMCKDCASAYAVTKARENAGFVAGTQVTKITNISEVSENLSGYRGVYFDTKRGLYRARIKFQGKLYNLGTFTHLEDAVKARRLGEEKYFEKFLAETSEEKG